MTRLVSLLVLLVVLAGCGSTGAGSAAGSGSDSAAGSGSTSEAGAAPAALDFTATTVSGETFEASSLSGKPVVFWFWAPWCSTCRAQAPGVQSLAEKYGDDVSVVGVGGLSDEDAITDYAEEVTGFTQLVDPEGAVWRTLGVEAQSTYLVLDSAGATVEQGYLDDDALVAVVDELAG